MAGIDVMMLLRQQLANGSRSDVLRPLAWLIGLLVVALIGANYKSVNTNVQFGVLILLGGSVLLYGFAYVHCLLKNPDALRSERYAIQKLAIEKRVFGDDSTGLIIEDDRVRQSISNSQKSSAASGDNG